MTNAPAPVTSLTEATIATMQAAARETARNQDESFDSLRVRVTAKTGYTAFKLQYYSPETGAQREITLGSHGKITVREAKAKATAFKAQIANGIDPLEEKKRQQVERLHAAVKRDKDTISAAVDYYLDKRAFTGTHAKKQRSILHKQFAAVLGPDRPIASVVKADIRLVLGRLNDKPAARRNLWKAISPMFKHLVHDDLIETNVLGDVLPPPTVAARERVLADREIKLFWEACDNKIFGPLFKVLLLTGQRLEEVAGLKYSELDLDTKTWHLPAERSKNGRAHIIHLSPQVVAILASVRKYARSEFVFTTTGKSSVSGFSRAKQGIDRRMKAAAGTANPVQPWRLHDLRRTAATAMALIEPNVATVERVLNHISGETGGLVGIYQRAKHLEDRKNLLLSYSDKVESFLNGDIERLIDEEL